MNRPLPEAGPFHDLLGRRVLVVGDVMLDRFVWGEVERISPEAPVPIVRVVRETHRLGGAANVAANLAALGARPRVAGFVGADAAGEQIASMLTADGVGPLLLTVANRGTTVKTRIIARAQQVVRVDREDLEPIAEERVRDLTGAVVSALSDFDALVVSDYNKGTAAAPLLSAALKEARRRGLPVVVDPKLPDFSRYQPATVITPNQAEASRAVGLDIRTDDDCWAAARAILERIDTESVLVTRGERGMLLVERDAPPVPIEAAAKEVYDVTGAGDTVVAVLALALAAGRSLLESSRAANLGAGIVVGKVGTATLSLAELESAYLEGIPGRS